jgi:hypothetical protein
VLELRDKLFLEVKEALEGEEWLEADAEWLGLHERDMNRGLIATW